MFVGKLTFLAFTENVLELCNKQRDVFSRGTPDNAQVDGKVSMNKSVPHADYDRPGNARDIPAEFLRHLCCRFTNDFKKMNE
jgi:hypothetical protein